MTSLHACINRIQARKRHDKAPFGLGDIMVRYGHLLTSRHCMKQNSISSLCPCLWLHYASVGYHVQGEALLVDHHARRAQPFELRSAHLAATYARAPERICSRNGGSGPQNISPK